MSWPGLILAFARFPITDDLRKALRCRNYAEELRIIAADKLIAENSRVLLRLAVTYDQMAGSLEAIERSKNIVARR
ncbi:MAG TPA: hypothetical protein VEU06_00655 [Micropepsaceae bacterium]|nr:hypothetical protein [Micropepsaceae bacterium]